MPIAIHCLNDRNLVLSLVLLVPLAISFNVLSVTTVVSPVSHRRYRIGSGGYSYLLKS